MDPDIQHAEMRKVAAFLVDYLGSKQQEFAGLGWSDVDHRMQGQIRARSARQAMDTIRSTF